ncbi:MAG: hypothetical protein GF349_02600 [Candidatus Magasanikbacteria bacterium]|nr:hypothetical protein [Candidatus Magasanikbacteria bacterium]
MKKLLLIIIFTFVLLPSAVFATGETQFKARIDNIGDDFIRVENLDTKKKYTIDESFEVGMRQQLNIGDKVLVNEITMQDGVKRYVITDMIRGPWIYVLIFIFMLTVALIGGKQGVRSLFNLFLTLTIILFVVIPLVLKGWNPILVVVGGGSLAMLFNIYITYGINKKSHGTLISIIASLFLAALMSAFFVRFASLTGFVQEEASFIITLGYSDLDMRGILLAAIIVGTLGVIDDLAISQISLVRELSKANKKMTKLELFQSAFRVGRDHTSSMVNTLVLAYTGAAFPLMILFSIGNPPFDSLASILNNEAVATEIVRTLVGSICLLFTMPIAAWVGAWLFHNKVDKKTEKG